MKTESRLESLAKKPANELNARELNLVRRYQSYVRKLGVLKQKESRVVASLTTLQGAKQKLAARQSVLLEKIAAVEEESNQQQKTKGEEALEKLSTPLDPEKKEVKPKLKAVG